MLLPIFDSLRLLVALNVFLGLMLAGCATTYVEPDRPAPAAATSPVAAPPHKGPKTVVAVLPLGLSDRAAQRYPHLLDKNVGLGIHNRLTEALYDTGRFTFVEEKADIIKDVMDRQWMSANGMVSQAQAIEMGRMLGAAKVIYGEVYDYGEGGDQVRGLSARKNLQTRMGIQIRCVDVETLEYIPGSGTGIGHDVSGAADQALQQATASLLRRLP
ncbi:CsgG/HfaB family protein [Desulfuromonas thiophila]|uniref:CsgG/HfaB family protein n=1 Tax=Desulfuromonas thiophila TaxID=57664 RepID=UPI0029F5199A|nr:CsgG/HfaB family protein [Desulfuromonas thiophila]